MTKKHLTLRALLVVLSALVPTFANSRTDLNACYGETLDVSIIALESSDETDGSIVISLPEPQKWFVKTRDFKFLHDLPCQTEPIPVHSVRGSGLTDRDGTSEHFPDHLRRMSIFGSHASNSLYRTTYNFSDLLTRKGRSLPDGFFGFYTANPDNKPDSLRRGVFRFPQHHLSPLGEPVIWRCGSWECRGEYGFLGKLFVSYEFRNKDVSFKTWVNQDRALQAMITNWFH